MSPRPPAPSATAVGRGSGSATAWLHRRTRRRPASSAIGPDAPGALHAITTRIRSGDGDRPTEAALRVHRIDLLRHDAAVIRGTCGVLYDQMTQRAPRLSRHRRAMSASRQASPDRSDRLPEQHRELVPLDEEGVVALGRADLAVARVHARRRRRVDERVDLARAVQDVALDADAGQPRPAVPRARAARPRARRDPSPMSWRSIASARPR